MLIGQISVDGFGYEFRNSYEERPPEMGGGLSLTNLIIIDNKAPLSIIIRFTLPEFEAFKQEVAKGKIIPATPADVAAVAAKPDLRDIITRK